jgi:hypothetical protein
MRSPKARKAAGFESTSMSHLARRAWLDASKYVGALPSRGTRDLGGDWWRE